MNPLSPITTPLLVDKRLEELALTRNSLEIVAETARMYRNDSIGADPVNAPGLLSYIYGVRALRLELIKLNQGWEINRKDNIESIVNPNTSTMIVFQNTERAADKSIEPKAISNKGPANEKLVERSATKYLFEEMENEEEAKILEVLNSKKYEVWYYFVSFENDELRAELSRPTVIRAGQFTDFEERLFILDEESIEFEDTSSPPVDEFDVEVSLK